MMTFSFI